MQTHSSRTRDNSGRFLPESTPYLPPPCRVAGCDRRAKGRGLCDRHYLLFKRHGDPEHTRPSHEAIFWSRIRPAQMAAGFTPCWLWNTATVGTYGRIWLTSHTTGAHRFAYTQFRGPIPEGYQADHLCNQRSCVNPWHLEAVTPQMNTLRNTGPSAANATKTHCMWGHPLDEANTYITKKGQRHCRKCGLRRQEDHAKRLRLRSAVAQPQDSQES